MGRSRDALSPLSTSLLLVTAMIEGRNLSADIKTHNHNFDDLQLLTFSCFNYKQLINLNNYCRWIVCKTAHQNASSINTESNLVLHKNTKKPHDT